MRMQNFTIKTADREGVDIAIEWAAKEGWNPGLHDADCYFTADPTGAIDSYGQPFFPANRSRFVKRWINQPYSHALGILQGGALAGYGVIRACHTGYKIGPLFADNEESAESLFLALRSRLEPSDRVYLDTPEVNPAALALAARHGMRVSFQTARMYTGEAPKMPLDRLFGVTSFEIG